MNTAPRPVVNQGSSTALRKRWLVVAFVIAFLAIGSMHWTIPYSEVSLPNSLFGPALVLVVAAGFMARVLGRARFLLTTIVVGLAAPAAIAARVAVDTATDPTSHNLWPFELFLGGMVGHACAALGALMALLWTRKTVRR